MKSADLIGKVAAQYLYQQLTSQMRGEEADGTARFILDCLSASQTAAAARAVLDDSSLADKVEIKLPAQFMAGHELPESVLTDRRATYFRNAPCDKSVLLIANVGDDEQQSLKELVPIGAPELMSEPEIWVEITGEGLELTSEERKWWTKAITGLRDLRMLSLERLAEYMLRTRFEIEVEGHPIVFALGAALPALHMPRNASYFDGLNEKTRNHASRWRALFEAAEKKFACYLQKLTPTQIALTESDLEASFERVKDSIPENIHDTVQAFIHAPSGWNEKAAALAECEWEQVAPLFSGFKREKFNFGEATIKFYDDLEPELLNDEEREYLELLVKRNKPSSAYEQDDLEFYSRHRNELKADRKLKSAWDKFVFGTPLETEDFLAGIVLCCERLFSKDRPCVGRKLKVRSDRTIKKDLKELNVSAGLYFAQRYRGLKSLFGRRVVWDVGPLFKFDELVEEWKESRTKLNDSTARAALQIKFILELEVEFEGGGTQKYSTQMLWKFNPNTVVSEFAQDWLRLTLHPFVRCTAHREPLSSKGQFQSLDLSDVKTFVPAYGKDRGSFVPIYKRANDIAILWIDNLKRAREQRIINDDVAQELRERFESFRDVYTSAISGFTEEGLSHPDLLGQLHAYSALLDALYRKAKGDRSRELLLKPILQIGTVEIIGGQATAIITPWHPLRLAAIVRKAQLVTNLLDKLLTTPQIDFGDSRLFFGDIKEELAHPFYPEVVLGWHGNNPEILALSDTVGDYTLHEMPVVTNADFDDTNENPAEAAKLVVDLVHRYLELHPHEVANLSVVLYNCDSARLPQAVVDKIGAMHTDEEEIRCQVILRHRDPKRLRSLYEKLIEAADADADSFNASEATRDFMARLRIGIMADQAPPPSAKDGLPTDIAFSQDVIARHARVEWYYEDATPIEFDKWIPPRWSRRKPAATDDLKSMVYLCCPVQSVEGWTFLTAITSFIKEDGEVNEQRRQLPARQLNFRDNATANIFNETHRLANWVVNYDELLDRRQLMNQGVRIIRYKQTGTQGRNLIISSDAPLSLLRSMVLSRLKSLTLDLDEVSYHALADKFISDAKDISGDIVLRAAKRGRNASELIGVVLSRFLVHQELGLNRYYGWYFLDDYANWLGQREEQIADIMVLSPEISDEDDLRLAVVVTESKYIDASGLSAKRRESQKQLRDTVQRIREAVFGNPERLDRELWLSRLSDLLLDGVQFPASANIDLGKWRRAIREGKCEIFLRGYSHVFVSGPSDSGDTSDFARVAGVEDSYQEVFSRAQVRQLVLSYFNGRDPLPIRVQSAGEENRLIWTEYHYHKPAGFKTEKGKSKSVDKPQKQQQERSPEQATHRQAGASISETALDTSPPEQDASATKSSLDTDKATHEAATSTKTASTSLSETTGGADGSSAAWSSPLVQPLLDSWSATEQISDDDQQWMKQLESKMRAALQQFQLQAKLLKSVLTPNSALLKFVGSDNLTVEQVLKRRSEFLTTHGLNIISVGPEPGLVSIAVERPRRQIIQLPEVWRRWKPESDGGNQEVLIGIREADGELMFLSPSKHHAPHTLIAGSTGSGKSVLMQNIILGVAATNTPAQARIVLIDPKQGVDYFQFDGLSHLEGGIIDNQEEALSKLQALVSEMDNRYAKFKAARANNLASYNRKVEQEQKLPAIWVVHDEFAEWMMIEEYKEEVTALVGRLGVKARAAGLYLVFAAQRPDANVMPMQLRANLGNRLILRVDSEGTSEIALGERGAERLLGRGHMLAKLEGAPLCYAQVPFIEEDFLANLVEALQQ